MKVFQEQKAPFEPIYRSLFFGLFLQKQAAPILSPHKIQQESPSAANL
jgi:hypothetical protein